MIENKTATVREYVDTIDVNIPIFIGDIKNLVGDNAKLILSRLERCGLITRYDKGVYYKTKQTAWGTATIGKDAVVKYKYIQDRHGNIKGYVTGARLFNRMGLTTQVPRMTEIVTNEYTGKNKVVRYGTLVQRAKILVTNENYLYQQIIDIIENKNNIQIEVDAPDAIIRNFYNDNNLDFATLYKIGLERKMSSRNLERMGRWILNVR
jgi:predicted transcriptional regulator of viral defense system